MHKTTLSLEPAVWMRVRNLATRRGTSVAAVVNWLLRDALSRTEAGESATSLAAGESDTDDLGTNATKHLRETIR